jgi:HEAT repeat protein
LATWQVGKFLRKKAAPLVLQLADDSSDFVRGQVAVAAGRFKECCPQTVATLVRKLLQDRNEFVRQYAAQNLVGVREFSASDLPVLRRALQDELRDVKYFALEALMRTHQPEAWAIAAKHLRYYYWCAASANGPPY